MNNEVSFGFVAMSFAVVALIIVLAKVVETYADKRNGNEKKKQMEKTRRMVNIAMLSAVSVVLMLFEIALPMLLPPFYKLDASELPVIIGAFTMGPVAGVIIEFVKVMLNLLIDGTTTAFVGEFANFLIGCSYVVPASMVYYFKKTKKNAVIGLVLGTVVCVVCGCLLNAYLLLPAYSKAFHMEIEAIIAMGTAVNKAITNMLTFVMFATAPLNLIKCASVSILTMLLYKPISRILKGE